MQARHFSTSAFLRAADGASVPVGAGDGEGPKPSAHGVRVPPVPDGSGSTRIVFVQRPGAKISTPLAARGDMLVGFVVEEIKKKLELSAQLDSITLRVASEDGKLFTAKGTDGTEQPVTLDSMDTIDKALEKAAKAAGRTIAPEDKLRIIVVVAAPAVPPAASDGEVTEQSIAG